MLDIQNPLWSFFTNFLGIIAGIVSIICTLPALITFFKQKTPKGIAYDIVSSSPILNLNEDLKGKIQVLFNEKPVEKLHQITLRIINYGSLSIPSKDFETPFQIKFGSTTEVLQTEILQTEPLLLKNSVELSIKQGQLILSPLLLNSQDMIDIRILLSNFSDQIEVHTRIEGVKDILKFENLPKNRSTRAINRLVAKVKNTVFTVLVIFTIIICYLSYIYKSISNIPKIFLYLLISPTAVYFSILVFIYTAYPAYILLFPRDKARKN